MYKSLQKIHVFSPTLCTWIFEFLKFTQVDLKINSNFIEFYEFQHFFQIVKKFLNFLLLWKQFDKFDDENVWWNDVISMKKVSIIQRREYLINSKRKSRQQTGDDKCVLGHCNGALYLG